MFVVRISERRWPSKSWSMFVSFSERATEVQPSRRGLTMKPSMMFWITSILRSVCGAVTAGLGGLRKWY